MTTHAEWPVPSIASESPRRRWSVPVMAASAAVVLAGAGVTLGVLLTHGQQSSLMPPKAVLGESLRPLAVYQRLPIAAQPGHRAKAGDMTRSKLGQPGHFDVLRAAPVTSLHVQYAHVRPVDGHWQIEFIAPDGLTPTPGKGFDVLVHGQALTLFTVKGSFDGTNYAIGPQANWLTAAQAVAVAKSLTTSVTVAHCSQAAIAANECA